MKRKIATSTLLLWVIALWLMPHTLYAYRISVSEANDIAAFLGDSVIEEQMRDVIGVVSNISRLNLKDGHMNLDITNGHDTMFCYHLMNLDSTAFSSDNALHVGDTITIRTHLQNFHGESDSYCGYLLEVHGKQAPSPTQAQSRNLVLLTFLLLVVLFAAGISAIMYLRTRRKLNLTKEEASRYKDRSELDFLTGIYNRYGGEVNIGNLILAKHPGYFAIIDIDLFKMVNDTYGHLAGDELLRQVTQALPQGPEFTAMRYGGDEFVIYSLLPPSEAEYRQLIDQLFQRIGAISIPELNDHHISLSIGAIYYDGLHPETFSMLFGKADQLLYDSKRQQGNWLTLG